MVEVMDRAVRATQHDIESSNQTTGEGRVNHALNGDWLRRVRTLVSAIDPPLEERELAYRQQFLRADATQAALCIAFIVVPLLFFWSTDYLLLGTGVAFVLLGLIRLVLAAFSVFIVVCLRRVRDPRAYDDLIAVWTVGAVSTMVIVNMTRPPTFTQPIMLYAVIVLALFVIVPNQLWHRFLLAGLYLGGNVLMVATGHRIADPVTTNLIWGTVILTNVIGVAIASHFSRMRRRQFVVRLEMERVRDRLQIMATIDGLTGVLNRRRFLEIAAEELERARRYERPLSVIAIDLDYFRTVNDRFGHAVGDDVLAALARTLQEQTRRQDVVGRTGGEEFAVILPETSIETAIALAERMRVRVSAMKLSVGGIPLTVTTSLGVAEARASDRSAQEMFCHADQALYRAKHLGRDRVEVA
jgi:diguanylate cyclase (GGDEF)-like protein